MPPELLSLFGGGNAGGGIAGIASGILGLGVGALQRHSANKWLKGHQQPMEQIPGEFLQNQREANRMAGEGLPSEQYNLAMKNIQRNQANALRSAGDRRVAAGVLPGILDQGNSAMGQLDAENAQARINNQRYAMGVNSEVGGIKRALFKQNQLDPYLREYDYKMGELGAGNQNLTGGFDKLSAGALGLFGGGGSRRNNGGYRDPNFKIPIPSFPDIYPTE